MYERRVPGSICIPGPVCTPAAPFAQTILYMQGSYSSALLRELPDQMHTLRLGAKHIDGFDITAIEGMVQRSRAHKTSPRALCVNIIVSRLEDDRRRVCCF